MSRKQAILLGLLGLFVLVVSYLAFVTRQPPVLPMDGEHRPARLDTCLDCHDADGVAPRSKNHPMGLDCLRCHGS